MTPLFQNFLLGHILCGLLATVSSVMVFLGLVKNAGFQKIRINSLVGVLGFFISWILGGYYYVNFYGQQVKPAIKSGNYPWAHGIFMETKEHIFLFLPFLSLVLALLVWFLKNEVNKNSRLKKAGIFLAFMIIVLAVSVTFMGMLISGAVK